MEGPRFLTKGILIIARKLASGQILKRVTSHVTGRNAVDVGSFAEAEVELMRREPSAVIIDVSDFKSGEFKRRVEPFILGLPGWIKIFLVDPDPSPTRLQRAKDLGINGVLRSPLSHHSVSQLVNNLPPDKKA